METKQHATVVHQLHFNNKKKKPMCIACLMKLIFIEGDHVKMISHCAPCSEKSESPWPSGQVHAMRVKGVESDGLSLNWAQPLAS